VAVVDSRYIERWDERIGHLVWFEALPDAREPARLLLEEACKWLGDRDIDAVRTGFANGMLDFPYLIDAYQTLPPSMLRHNPPAYHTLIKQADFEVEQGFVDIKVAVSPELVKRWESSLEGARRSGFEIVPLSEISREQRLDDFTATFADTFNNHWGWTPFSRGEIELLLDTNEELGALETSVLAYRQGEPVGMLFVTRDDPDHAILAPGRTLEGAEKLNVLSIGVRESARGRGVNYAMASYAFIELVRRGHSHLSYTLVLDDNWPSRRTGEGLGGEICANYLAYSRNLRR
jgi:GNAT superfamily N-acetyltransferase